MAVEKDNSDLAEERQIEFIFDVPSGLPILNLDSTRATQAINKLVNNAIKYTPEGGKVTVSAAPAEGGLEIIVTDNGVGMHPEEIEHPRWKWRFSRSSPTKWNMSGVASAVPRSPPTRWASNLPTCLSR
jgi:signal transduction histidine kinase